MEEITVMVNNKAGLHARPVKIFVEETRKFESTITIARTDNKQFIDGKNIFRVLSLGASRGTELIIQAEGKDEGEAVKKMQELFDNNLYEKE